MIFALVAMVMMTMSANAQSNDNNSKLTFDLTAKNAADRIQDQQLASK